MKRPPNIVITLLVAGVTFGLIVLVKQLLAPPPPGPWLTDEAAAFARAKDQRKGVVIDFHARWSIPSDEMSRTLDVVRPELDRDFVPLRIDISDDSPRSEEMRMRYGANTYPAVMFVDTDGRLLGTITTVETEHELRETARLAASRRRR